ncbi:Ficolin-1 [Penaeus vannamei]|uniref:Ficolin-1 n=1 Tax=Penaeus vannamei TaxID=6689 RepID=A0A3R7PNQ2_PENVA|nr:Ficolin-1 [Penaeus vannamei]
MPVTKEVGGAKSRAVTRHPQVAVELAPSLREEDANVNIEWPGDVHVKAQGKTLIVLLGEDNENIKVNINATLIDGDSGLVPVTPAPTVAPTPAPTAPPPQLPVISEKNCLDIKNNNFQLSGIYVVAPYDCCPDKHVSVYCDMDTDGGGWTVIQRRDQFDNQIGFFRGWDEYVSGFGKLRKLARLDNIHALTNQTNYEIRFDLFGATLGEVRSVPGQVEGVQLRAEDRRLLGQRGRRHELPQRHGLHRQGQPRPQRVSGEVQGGVVDSAKPERSNLAGPHNDVGVGVNWYEWRRLRYSLKFSEMKIRPK